MEQDIPTTPTSQEPSSKRKKYLFAAIATLIIIASIPITYALTQQQQDIRQRASETQICGNSPADVMLVMDISGSMRGSQLSDAKDAAKTFVNNASQDSENRIGLVSFDSRSDLETGLTNNFSDINTEIERLRASGSTCLSCGIKDAADEINTSKRDQYKNVVIILTDGRANRNISGSISNAKEEAKEKAKELFDANNTVFFTIGLGSGRELDEDILKEIASETGGEYYNTPTSSQLEQIYQEILEITGKGIISGIVYEDQDENGTHDDHEPTLSGWDVVLEQNGAQVATQTTDENGGYSFNGLCNETFEASLITKNDWTATSPENGTHQVAISQGQAENETNFGVIERKDPAVARIQVQMPGIGQNTGDNATPSAETRTAEITIFDTQNQPIKEGTGSATFDGTDTYVGTVNLGTEFTSGIYYAQVRFDNTLRSRIDGVHQINEGETTDFPLTTLASGDLDQNNILDLRDYNIFLSCFNDEGCDEISKRKADLNDNGDIEPVDYNILLRSFAIREGA